MVMAEIIVCQRVEFVVVCTAEQEASKLSVGFWSSRLPRVFIVMNPLGRSNVNGQEPKIRTTAGGMGRQERTNDTTTWGVYSNHLGCLLNTTLHGKRHRRLPVCLPACLPPFERAETRLAQINVVKFVSHGGRYCCCKTTRHSPLVPSARSRDNQAFTTMVMTAVDEGLARVRSSTSCCYVAFLIGGSHVAYFRF